MSSLRRLFVYLTADEGEHSYAPRHGDRRGSGIPVVWYHGDRRIGARRAIEAPVEAPLVAYGAELIERVGGHEFHRYTESISRDGLLVRFAVPHPRNTLVRLSLTLADGQPLKVWARVLGPVEERRGMRYRFVGLSREDRARLEALCPAPTPPDAG